MSFIKNLPPYAAAGIRTPISQRIATSSETFERTLYRLSYRDHGTFNLPFRNLELLTEVQHLHNGSQDFSSWETNSLFLSKIKWLLEFFLSWWHKLLSLLLHLVVVVVVVVVVVIVAVFLKPPVSSFEAPFCNFHVFIGWQETQKDGGDSDMTNGRDSSRLESKTEAITIKNSCVVKSSLQFLQHSKTTKGKGSCIVSWDQSCSSGSMLVTERLRILLKLLWVLFEV